MAIDGFCVNGTALVSVGTGSAGALETLGYTDQGVDIEIEELTNDIITDVMGMAPQEVQSMGMIARITVPLIAVDRTVLAKITGRGDRTTVGLVNTPGLLLGTNSHLFRVGIAAPLDTPWSFSKCFMRPGFGAKLATKANPFRVQFTAIPYAAYTVTSGKDTPLWTRSLA
jgi:hypothetical protein